MHIKMELRYRSIKERDAVVDHMVQSYLNDPLVLPLLKIEKGISMGNYSPVIWLELDVIDDGNLFTPNGLLDKVCEIDRQIIDLNCPYVSVSWAQYGIVTEEVEIHF